MSGVDVLAVMTSVAARTPKHDDMLALDESRAAVAELIAAAEFARYTGNGVIGYTPGADRRLQAALARVGGAA